MTKLVLIGAGGHAKSCIGVIESSGLFSIEGYIDPQMQPGHQLFGYPVLGDNDKIAELNKQGDIHFLVAVGQIQSADLRFRLFSLLEELNANIIPVVVAKSAFVSPHAIIGQGTIVMHNAVVNTNAHVGKNAIINNFALVEHDCVIGDHVHVSTGAIVNGDCRLGDRVFIGSNAVLVQGITITSGVVIGAGSTVVRSIAGPGMYAGNPAKKIK